MAKVRQKLRKSAPKKAKAKRGYNNQARVEKSMGSQKLIIETLVSLLVARKGADVTFEDIAKKSKISIRTIYRFFKDKESLHQAMDEYLVSYLTASSSQLAELDFVGFGKNAYKLFDQNEELVMAYLYSPFGQEARLLFRKKLNQALLAKILQKKPMTLTTEKQKKIALIISLVNAKIWHDVKIDWGYSGSEMGEAVSWALETLLREL